jgi:sigma-B regulation protein RsbU (phosphoserine phosphatase)
MTKRSIGFQLGIYVLSTVIAVVSLIVFLNYKHSKEILMQKIEEGAIHQSSLIINQISINVVNTQEIAKNVATQVSYYQSHGDLQFFLHEVLKNNQVVNGLRVMLFQNGDTTTYSSFRYSPQNLIKVDKNDRNCPVFQTPDILSQLARAPQGFWCQPYYCPEDSSNLLISYYLPVYNQQNDTIGIVAGDINLKFLSNVISNIPIKKNGFAFIIAKEGDFLTHPNEDWVMKKNIFEIDSRIFTDNRQEYIEDLESNQTGSGFAYPEMLNYEKSWFYFAPVVATNWKVIIVIPTNELFNELDGIFEEIVLVSVVGIMLILLIIIFLFKRMFSPLSQAVKSIQRFSFGDHSLRRRGRKNEIELLNESLQALQDQYGTYMREQLQVRKDKRKYEKDLKSAKEIQRTIIPQDFSVLSKHKEIELYAILKPVESIGGDLYDFFFIDEKHLLFTMGDVSGKGIPAALFMAVANTMIKSKSTELSAAGIVDSVNQELSKENSNQHFLTLFLGILDIETGILDYCNAAHNYPFLLGKSKGIKQLEHTHGLPIGVYSNKSYESDSIVLSKGETLVLYTDGVTDCKNPLDEFYGQQRLLSYLQGAIDYPSKLLVDNLMEDLKGFKSNAKQADDISVMAIRFNGKYT